MRRTEPESTRPRKTHAFAVDERLVMPETRFEVLEGRVHYVSPADYAHGSRHAKIVALLEAYVVEDYEVACDMLTRTSETSDIAPDVSVFPRARDPETGGRKLEELAFEIVSTGRASYAAKKARSLFARGVRRIFAIDVKKNRALAWSGRTNTWELLPPDGVIADRVLVAPLALEDVVNAVRTDDAIATALLAKKNPVLAREIERGQLKAKIEALLAVLEARAIRLSTAERRLIRQTTSAKALDGLIRRAATCKSASALFAAPTKPRRKR